MIHIGLVNGGFVYLSAISPIGYIGNFDSLKKHGLRSPDQADALVLAIAQEKRTPSFIDFFDRKLSEMKKA